MLNKWSLLFFLGCSPWVIEATGVQDKSTEIQEVESETWLQKWAKSDKDVAIQFHLFKQSLEKGVKNHYFTEDDIEKILRAVAFSAEKHSSQFRKNSKKTPYVIHPLGVANYIITVGGVYDVDVIIAALLHDVMDGTDATYEEIAAHFGLKVTQYVQEVTVDPTLSEKENKKQQMIQAPHQSREVALIKLADKLHNLNTLMKDPSEGWSQDRLDAYFQWVQAVADQLPVVNQPLKGELDTTITNYWDEQGKRAK